MAQPTVTSRPSTWSGTSGPILYKLTSTNYANAGYRLEVEIWNSTTAAKIADAVYSADSGGLLECDVSTFLKSNVALTNDSDLTSGTVYTDTNWIKYYIKYQEVWTASSETQVNDSGNQRYAVYGGLQIGSANDFTDYVPSTSTKKFLTISTNHKAISGYPFTISLIGGDYAIELKKYLAGVLGGVGGGSLSSKVQRIKFDETAYDTIEIKALKETVSTWTNGFIPTPASFQFDTVSTGLASSTGATAATIDIFHKAYSGALNVPVYVFVRVTSSNLGGLVELSMTVYDSAKVSSFSSTSIPITANGIYLLQATSGSIIPAYVQIEMTNGTAGAVDWTVQILDEPASETITVDIEEECDNTVVLQWKNSLGGDECFPFEVNQEYTWHYSNRKAKRLTLYADNLTLNQWETIQGLNTLGELYKVPIPEMTTSLNRTMGTIGQAVYILNSDGTKTGVNVIGSPNTTNTKQKKHSAFVTIEYPELFLQ